MPRLEGIQTELGLGSYINSSRNMIDVLAITLALMAGTAGLPHVIVRFYTVPSVRAARYSAGWALLFIGLLYTTVPALAVFAWTRGSPAFWVVLATGSAAHREKGRGLAALLICLHPCQVSLECVSVMWAGRP